MINGAAALAELVRAAGDTDEPGVHRVLPVAPELSGLLPGRGLRRGSTVAVATGREAPASGGTSLLLALLAEASRSGSWCAVVGVPTLGAVAAAESGISLERLALVPNPGPEWPTVVAALIDGVDLVVIAVPGPISASVTSRLVARARQRGSVLVPFGRWDGADVTLRVVDGRWEGLDAGHGRLRRRQVTILARGRGAAARPKELTMWMPGVTIRQIPLPPAPAADDPITAPTPSPAEPAASEPPHRILSVVPPASAESGPAPAAADPAGGSRTADPASGFRAADPAGGFKAAEPASGFRAAELVSGLRAAEPTGGFWAEGVGATGNPRPGGGVRRSHRRWKPKTSETTVLADHQAPGDRGNHGAQSVQETEGDRGGQEGFGGASGPGGGEGCGGGTRSSGGGREGCGGARGSGGGQEGGGGTRGSGGGREGCGGARGDQAEASPATVVRLSGAARADAAASGM